MKKMLKTSLLLALALPVMVGCNKGPSYKETRTEEDLILELAQQALAEVGVGYASFSSTGLAYGDNDLITSVNEKVWEGDEIGLNFSIKYTLIPQEDNFPKEFVTLSEEGDKLIAGLVKMEELSEVGKALEGAAYTLKADVYFDGYGENFKVNGLTTTDTFLDQKISTKSWNAIAKVAKVAATLGQLKATTKNNDYVIFQGVYNAWYSDGYDELYSGAFIANGNDAIMIYAGTITEDFFDAETKELKIHAGDAVEVFGRVSPYNGLYEVKPISVTKITDQSVIESIATPVENPMTVTQVNESKIDATGKLVTLTGLKIKELPKELKIGSHWTIKAEDASKNEITIYVNYHVGEAAQTAIKTVIEGLGESTFTFHGVLSCYNKMQVSPVNTATGTAAGAFVAE